MHTVESQPQPVPGTIDRAHEIDLPLALDDVLCCPNCRCDLELGRGCQPLVCERCGDTFQVRDGIPLMFRRADLADPDFVEFREGCEKHAHRDLFVQVSDVTQAACLRIVARFIGDDRDHLILDVGSADGKLGEIIGAHVVCLDISETYLSAARGKGLAAFAGSAYAMPFKRVFDVVVLSNVLEHLADPARVMSQVREVLKPSGRVYVVVPYREDISVYQGSDSLSAHVTSFDDASIRRLLEGFRILRQRPILFATSRAFLAARWALRRWAPGLRETLRDARRAGASGRSRAFPRWKSWLDYLPTRVASLFFNPYSVMIEAVPEGATR